MKTLIGCKVFGNWGEAGWDYGIIVNEYTDSYGTDIVIKWEDGRLYIIDFKETIEINGETDILSVGVYIDVTGEHLSSSVSAQASQHDTKQTAKSYTTPKIIHYHTYYTDIDKLQAVISCLVDITVPLYGHRSLLLSEQQHIKSLFFKELNKYNVVITSSMLDKAKRLRWNNIYDLLNEYSELFNRGHKTSVLL